MTKVASLTIAAATLAFSVAAAQTKNVWDGVYSDAQAGRGKKSYVTHCAACHNEGLQGGDLAPELKGEDFLLRWNDKSMFEFVDRIQKTMPQDNPGGLMPQENADHSSPSEPSVLTPAHRRRNEEVLALLATRPPVSQKEAIAQARRLRAQSIRRKR